MAHQTTLAQIEGYKICSVIYRGSTDHPRRKGMPRTQSRSSGPKRRDRSVKRSTRAVRKKPKVHDDDQLMQTDLGRRQSHSAASMRASFERSLLYS